MNHFYLRQLCFHFGFQIDPEKPEEVQAAQDAYDKMVAHAVRVGGTCTGEHGVGLGKRKYMRMEYGEAVDVMHLVKNALDPQGILNPGKVLPD